MRRRRFLPWTILIPAVVVVSLPAVFALQQLYYDWQFHREIRALELSGQPVDLASLFKRHFETTSQSQTVARTRLTHIHHAGLSHHLIPAFESIGPGGRSKYFQSLLSSEDEWPEKALFKRYLEEQRSVYSELKRLKESAVPTWRPMFSSTGEWERSLCNAAFRLAYHDGDSERAMEALKVYRSTMVANDQKFDIGYDFMHLGIEQSLYQLILQSTTLPEFWQKEDLTQLDTLVQQTVALNVRWRNVMSGERAKYLEMLRKESGWLYTAVSKVEFDGYLGFNSQIQDSWITNSDKYQLLGIYNEAVQVAEPGYENLIARAEVLQSQKIELGKWLSLYPPIPVADDPATRRNEAFVPLRYYAERCVETENLRRLAAVAVGLRRFAIEKDRWPNTLAELAQVGVPQEVLRQVDQNEWSMVLESKKKLIIKANDRFSADEQLQAELLLW